MILRLHKRNAQQGMLLLLGFFLLTSLLVGVSFTTQSVDSATNITNQTVLAVVNVTNTEPNITQVIVDDNIGTPADEIDLTANNATVVQCNATIFDFNGWEDIDGLKTAATFFVGSVGPSADPDNNHMYVNNSCDNCVQGDTSTEAICNCQFGVEYYANDSNQWFCQFNVTDSGGTAISGQELNQSDYQNSSAVTVTKLLALDTGPLINYGNLSVTQTSTEVIHNVSNVGNIDLNLTLHGYGGSENTSVGENYSMICDFGNISWGQQRYLFGDQQIGTSAFDSMINLTNMTQNVPNSTLRQKIEDSAIGHERNTSLWRLQVPLSVGGICNGTIIFGAIDADV